jgi:hypothetical protein
MRSQLTTVVLLAVFGGSMYAAEKTSVDVYLSNRDDSSELLRPGKVVASAIFERIGVHLNWRSGGLPATQSAAGNGALQKAFGIRTLERAPESATGGALASARIVGLSGTEITVYEDRLQRFFGNHSNLARAGAGAGYVLAHELAHVMQGVARHSESGILKAQWSSSDFEEMVFHRLAFTNFDVELIHQGLVIQLANRRSESLADGSAGGLAAGGFPVSGSQAGSDLAKR